MLTLKRNLNSDVIPLFSQILMAEAVVYGDTKIKRSRKGSILVN